MLLLSASDNIRVSTLALTMAAILPYGLILPWQYISYLSLLIMIQFSAIYFKHDVIIKSELLLKLIFIAIGLLFIAYFWNPLKINVIGMAVLCLVLALKPLELKSQRDQQVWIVLSYFAVIAVLFFDSSFLLFIYSSLFIIFLTAFVSVIHFPGETFKTSLKNAIGLLLKTAPIVLILFIIFPRLGEPVWNLSSAADNGHLSQNGQGVSGISNTLNPGDLSQLSLSQDTAFRVQFNGLHPKPENLYWRANTFYYTDGKQWISDYYVRNYYDLQTPVTIKKFTMLPKKKLFEYSINQDANQKQWLFTLGLPVQLQSVSNTQVVLSEDNLLLAKNPIQASIQYTQKSYTGYMRPGRVNKKQRALQLQALQLPDDKSSVHRTIMLAKQWRETYSNDNDLLLQALKWFAEESFFYSRNVLKSVVYPIDSFLFEGRKGYCGHYATAFTLLMRAANIPARVVSGYRGGEPSDIGDFLTIKQANAHAWVEVWLEEEGWIRIDPTAVIPSERILEDDLLAQRKSETTALRNTQKNLRENDHSGLSNYSSFNQYLEYMDYLWDVWVIQYGQSNQRLLLTFSGLNNIITALLSIIVIFVFLFIIFFIIRRQKKIIALVDLYRLLLKVLQENGFDTYPNEGPETLKRRLVSNLLSPTLCARHLKLIRWLDSYIKLRYNNKGKILDKKQVIVLQKKIHLIFSDK